jgi:hypothetical protein
MPLKRYLSQVVPRYPGGNYWNYCDKMCWGQQIIPDRLLPASMRDRRSNKTVKPFMALVTAPPWPLGSLLWRGVQLVFLITRSSPDRWDQQGT